MVDVPLRHRNPPTPRPQKAESWGRTLAFVAAGIVLVIAVGGLVQTAIELYHERLTLTDLTTDRAPVGLAIGAERLQIPANMLRFGRTRGGGPVERADLVLHWPMLEGYSVRLAEAFKDGAPTAPIIYATIAARESPLDSTARLDEVYARFFVGKALPGPDGLVGKRLSAESGYGDEVVFFAPSEPRPFVARCLPQSTPELPATCLRDVNFGRTLSLLYRFNRNLLGEWRKLDTGMRTLAAGFLKE